MSGVVIAARSPPWVRSDGSLWTASALLIKRIIRLVFVEARATVADQGQRLQIQYMVDQNYATLISQGAAAWNGWRRQHPEQHLDLRGVSFHKASLAGIDLSRADLSDCTFSKSRLQNADLRGAKLRRSDFSRAVLRGADFTGATLCGANLAMSDLRKANFSHGDLTGATLRQAKLANSKLRSAQLIRADFLGASLFAADLSDALLSETLLADALLAETVGLETCRHQGPSVIDHRTLQRSGKLPLNFLRSCGLPEPLIDYLPSLLNQPLHFYSCFISYSHQDKSFARRLHNELQANGIRCWLDDHQILPGDDIYDQVDQAIRLWDKILLCCSEASLTSWWVDNEIDSAFEKERLLMAERKHKVLSLIPLDLDGYLFSDQWSSGKQRQVRSRLAADFTGWQHDHTQFEQAFAKLLVALQAEDGGRQPPPQPKL